MPALDELRSRTVTDVGGRQPPARGGQGFVGATWQAIGYCLVPVRLRRTLAITLVVGTVLTLLNQGDVILSGDASMATLLKSSLNYLIPFVVSNLGLLSGRDAVG